jgi:hypothetical protein
MFKVRAFEVKTTSWWFGERDNIDMEPKYQRKSGVWDDRAKAYLIDSMINEFDIPKIYIADFTFFNSKLNDNKKPYAIVDGKQRLESIFAFFDGNLNLNEDFIYFSDKTLKLGGLSYKELKTQYPKISQKLDNFNLSVMSIITDEEEKIHELFLRLNKSKSLTGAELRAAIGGEMPSIIKQISEHKFFKKNIAFSVRRKQDENLAAKFLLIETNGMLIDTKKISLDRFVEEGVKMQSADFKSIRMAVIDNLDLMTDSYIEKDPLLKNSGLIVLHYWLFKNNSKYLGRIRNFLNFWHDKVKQDDATDPDVLKYSISIRSINDGKSLTDAYSILEKRFIRFIKKQ